MQSAAQCYGRRRWLRHLKAVKRDETSSIRNVELNRLQSRVKIMGHCDQEQLRRAIGNGQTSLVIVDVEGAEGQLLNPATVPGLANAHVIVEIHDFIDQEIGEILLSRLKSSHVVEEVRTRARTLWDFYEPRALWLRLLLLPYLKQYANEFRPGPMRWFCCTPITVGQAPLVRNE